MKRFSAAFSILLLLSACGAPTSPASGCAQTSDCRAGQVCISGACSPADEISLEPNNPETPTSDAPAPTIDPPTIDPPTVDSPIVETVPLDTTPPNLVATFPIEGALSVGQLYDLALGFDEKIDQSSLQVTTKPKLALGAPTWGPEGQAVLFSLPVWAAEKAYTLQINARDLAGNVMPTATLSFTTVDTLAPTVTSTTPADEAKQIAPGAKIQITFSEKMKSGPGKLRVNDTDLTCTNDGTWSTSGLVFTCDPAGPLAEKTMQEFSVQGFQDERGHAMATPYAFRFKTGGTGETVVDTTAPHFVSSTPENDATSVPLDTELVFVFDEPMDIDSVEAAVFCDADADGNSDAHLDSATATRFTFSLDVDLHSHQNVHWYLTGAKDAAGNAMQVSVSGNFTTTYAWVIEGSSQGPIYQGPGTGTVHVPDDLDPVTPIDPGPLGPGPSGPTSPR